MAPDVKPPPPPPPPHYKIRSAVREVVLQLERTVADSYKCHRCANVFICAEGVIYLWFLKRPTRSTSDTGHNLQLRMERDVTKGTIKYLLPEKKLKKQGAKF